MSASVSPYVRWLKWPLILIVSLISSFLVFELAVSFYFHAVLKWERTTNFDAQLGWSNRPNIDAVVRNPDGQDYLWKTDGEGARRPVSLPKEAARRVLILGDSFVAGQDVAVEDRFDARMARNKQDWAIAGVGSTGWGTDQALMAGHGYFSSLQTGDWLVILNYSNDFRDNSLRRQFGRQKPYFLMVDGKAVLHPVVPSLFDSLRENLFSPFIAMRLLGIADVEAVKLDPPNPILLYRTMIDSYVADLAKRGVHIAIVYHGYSLFRVFWESSG